MSKLKNLTKSDRVCKVLFIALFCCLFHLTKAQQFDSNLVLAHTENLNLCTQKARNLLVMSKLSGEKVILQNYTVCLPLLLLENEKEYNLQANQEEKLLNLIEALESNASNDFFWAEIKVQWAFLHLKYGHEWKAFQSFRQVYKLLKINMIKYPNFLAQRKTYGLLLVLLATVPENYHWALSLFGLEGNEEQGLKYLQEVAESKHFYATEAQFLHCLLASFVLKKYNKALELLAVYNLIEKAKQATNPALLTYLVASICQKSGSAKIALLLVESPNLSKFCSNFPLIEHLRAESALLVGNYEQASKAYQNYLSICGNDLYVKDSYYKLFIIFHLLNEPQKAQNFLKILLTKGNTKSSADKTAQNFASNYVAAPKPVLLKIQLFTDGGEYEKALQMLEKQQLADFSKQEHYEFYYRKARLLHRMGKYEEALLAYKTVLDLPYQKATYFAPMSALQTAFIYEEVQKDRTKAKIFASKVLDYQGYEYESSMRNEAKKLIKK